MYDSKAARPRTYLLGLVLVVIALPACHSAHPWSGDQAGASSRVAYRPVPTSLRGRLFYVSGYGGADYTPARPRRRAPVDVVPEYITPGPVVNPPAVTIRQGTWDEP
jgi:hypothetical protein